MPGWNNRNPNLVCWSEERLVRNDRTSTVYCSFLTVLSTSFHSSTFAQDQIDDEARSVTAAATRRQMGIFVLPTSIFTAVYSIVAGAVVSDGGAIVSKAQCEGEDHYSMRLHCELIPYRPHGPARPRVLLIVSKQSEWRFGAGVTKHLGRNAEAVDHFTNFIADYNLPVRSCFQFTVKVLDHFAARGRRLFPSGFVVWTFHSIVGLLRKTALVDTDGWTSRIVGTKVPVVFGSGRPLFGLTRP